MPRVAGCDPGTSSLDLLALEDGRVISQARIEPAELRADPAAPVRWLTDHGPFDLVAGPSGYGLPLVRAEDCTDRQLALMSLVRPDEPGAKGVGGFSATVRALRASGLPVVFLPGVVHLPTVPAHRKLNKIDLGTADKLCVAALALAQHNSDEPALVVEFGSAFTALLVIKDRQIVDGLGGTSGPLGARSGGAWDGETAYLLSPLGKNDLFRGGMNDAPDRDTGRAAFRESFCKAVYGLLNTHGCQDVYYSGSLLRSDPDLVQQALGELPNGFFRLHYAGDLPGAWVKHAAQGAALLADGLCGGTFAPLVEWLRLRAASGTVFDWLTHPRAAEVRRQFLAE
ncbi:DUF1464 family protein [Gemmata sp. JC717]|uniref:DUF1464 family protein n=1 Tax=Gemmata algarum TaxID=2975278 RepID=UPI0021BA70BE|nr:DUF1464 family protein [Gemmata algarum]MDY3551280.1 DUF1464 family protein [Gemmata algarum]